MAYSTPRIFPSTRPHTKPPLSSLAGRSASRPFLPRTPAGPASAQQQSDPIEPTVIPPPSSSSSAGPQQPPPGRNPALEQLRDELSGVPRDVLNAKSEILLRLVSAGANVEAVIEDVKADIDDVMLKLLLLRIQSAKSVTGEGPELAATLGTLFQRLRTELERRTAPPWQRLLDDLLQLLGAEEVDLDARVEACGERMQRAFAPPGSQGVDIFAAAQGLFEAPGSGEGASAQPEEHVPGPLFVREVRGFLDEARRSCETVEQQAAGLRAEIDRMQLDGELNAAELREAAGVVTALDREARSRRAATGLIVDIVEMATELC